MGIKDSGKRQEFASGMVRDIEDDKIDYTLVLDGPMFQRFAEHLTKGARKYEARNWMKAASEVECERFKRSALRHFLQWFRGDTDEDHAAAVWFNVNGAEYVADKLELEYALDRVLQSDQPGRSAPQPPVELQEYGISDEPETSRDYGNPCPYCGEPDKL